MTPRPADQPADEVRTDENRNVEPGPARAGSWHFDTTAIRVGRRHAPDSLAPVLWPSTSYADPSPDEQLARATATHPHDFYARNGSPNVDELEAAMSALEGAEATLAYSSGMAALFGTLAALCSTGDHIVAQERTFTVTGQLFNGYCSRMGIDVTFVDTTDLAAVRAAVRPGRTQVIFAETPANPCLDLVDLEGLAAIAGPFKVVDGTFAPPPIQRALDFGIDLVVHSATKAIAGHNDALVGVVSGERELVEALWPFQVVNGAVCSPFDAWNALRGIRTLPTRLRQQSATAAALAEAVEAHPAVRAVRYPGSASHPQHDLARRQMTSGGTLLSFDLAGGEPAGRAFIEALELAQVAPSLGGPETLVVHPATMTAATVHPRAREAMGITDGLIRVSAGLEHVDDVIADIRGALDRAARTATG